MVLVGGDPYAGYFSLSELRALPQMSDTSRYPDDRLVAARDYVEALIERVCRTSFIARTKTATVTNPYGGSSSLLMLPDSWVLSVTSGTLDGVALDVSTLRVSSGVVYRASTSWPGYGSTFTLTYQAGWSEQCPPDLKEAALTAARARLVAVDGRSGVPANALSISNEFGNVQLATPGPMTPTGIPDADAVIMGYREVTMISGVA